MELTPCFMVNSSATAVLVVHEKNVQIENWARSNKLYLKEKDDRIVPHSMFTDWFIVLLAVADSSYVDFGTWYYKYLTQK